MSASAVINGAVATRSTWIAFDASGVGKQKIEITSWLFVRVFAPPRSIPTRSLADTNQVPLPHRPQRRLSYVRRDNEDRKWQQARAPRQRSRHQPGVGTEGERMRHRRSSVNPDPARFNSPLPVPSPELSRSCCRAATRLASVSTRGVRLGFLQVSYRAKATRSPHSSCRQNSSERERTRP